MNYNRNKYNEKKIATWNINLKNVSNILILLMHFINIGKLINIGELIIFSLANNYKYFFFKYHRF